MRFTLLLPITAVLCAASCGQASPGGPLPADTVATLDSPGASPPAATDLRGFLLSEPGTYGWQTSGDDIMLDFLADGRLHIQGPDGESTMWEGHWGLHGDGTVTLFRTDLGREDTLQAVREGDGLRLGDRLYTRYRP
jgi:hypothetical protein